MHHTHYLNTGKNVYVSSWFCVEFNEKNSSSIEVSDKSWNLKAVHWFFQTLKVFKALQNHSKDQQTSMVRLLLKNIRFDYFTLLVLSQLRNGKPLTWIGSAINPATVFGTEVFRVSLNCSMYWSFARHATVYRGNSLKEIWLIWHKTSFKIWNYASKQQVLYDSMVNPTSQMNREKLNIKGECLFL